MSQVKTDKYQLQDQLQVQVFFDVVIDILSCRFFQRKYYVPKSWSDVKGQSGSSASNT